MPQPILAWRPVLLAASAQAAVLSALSERYGYHRDELYFRMLHPGWGYLDQPPLTPLLARLTRVLADDEWALRIPATLAAAASVLLVAAITREVGGDRGAQTLAAWAYAFAALPLTFGHLLLTTSVDLPVWLALLLLIMRAQLRDEPRCWLFAGLVVGLGLYNKLLIVALVAALAAGTLLAGPRRLLISRPVFLAGAIALLVGLPNVVYQVVEGFPQLQFGRELARHNAADVRVQMWPTLALLLGPPLTVVWVVALRTLWTWPQWRPIRFVAAAFPVLLVLTFAMGTQTYYPLPLVSALFAIGAVPVTRWLRRRRWRAVTVVAAVAVNAAVSAVIALPLLPVRTLGSTPVPGINTAAADTVGWPRYTDQVGAVYGGLSPADRARAAIVASNYGEAGALTRYGPARGLPRVYSAHNQLYFQARPPDSVSIAVVVGGQVAKADRLFASCRTIGKLDNGVDVENEEQGEPIAVCREPIGGWSTVWPQLKHED